MGPDRKFNETALENLLKQWDARMDPSLVLVFVGRPEAVDLAVQLRDRLRLKHASQFVSEVPKGYENAPEAHIIGQHLLLGRMGIKEDYSPEAVWITVGESPDPNEAAVYSFGSLEEVADALLTGDDEKARELIGRLDPRFKELSPEQFSQWKKANPDLIRGWAIKPILGARLSEAANLYRLTRTVALNA